MTERLINIKEVVLQNNCPECFSKTGLRLTFRQKIKESKFYKSVTSEISHELNCTTCNSIIYPVQWTDDIDRVFDYQKKAFTPKKTSTLIKKALWIIIISSVLILALILILVFYFKL